MAWKNHARPARLFWFVLPLLASCGGGGGGSSSTDDQADGTEVTTFPGGTLEELKALDPQLNFDKLVITGSLILAPYDNVTLAANELVIEATGGIRYTYGDCEYAPAPDVTMNIAGTADIDGEIALNGRSGTRVLDSATCNSCYGQDGGDVTIVAGGALHIGSPVSTNGGNGGTSVSSWGSTGCSGGDAGKIDLQGTSLDLTGATMSSDSGDGGIGYIDGSASYGTDGAAGRIGLDSEGLFEMAGGSAYTDGDIDLQAASTDIYGALVADGSFNDLIAGATDTTPPLLEIAHPLSGMDVAIDQPLDVQIQVSDPGVGVKEVTVTGLGHDAVHAADGVEQGILTVTVARPSNPPELTVVAVDNKGNSTSTSVTDLRLVGSLVVPAGETYTLSGTLDLGAGGDVTIDGTLILARDGDTSIGANNLTVSGSGSIQLADIPEAVVLSKAPSLTLTLAGSADIAGTVDLSGHDGFQKDVLDYYAAYLNYHHGEAGGDLSLTAADITLAGQVTAAGGRAKNATNNGLCCDSGTPGAGGNITVDVTGEGTVPGTMSAIGGAPVDWNNSCEEWGDAGSITVRYATSVNAEGATIETAGRGDEECSASVQPAQNVLAAYGGEPDPQVVPDASEVEPNNFLWEGRPLFAPVRVSGTVAPADVGDIGVDSEYDIEDLYQFGLEQPMVVTVTLDSVDPSADLDLFLFEANTLVSVASSATVASDEAVSGLSLAAGNYIIGVSQWGDTPVDGTAYTLTVVPSALE